MRHVRWVLIVLTVICSGCRVNSDLPDGPRPRDLSVRPPVVDLSTQDMVRPPHAVGAACSTNSDCMYGPMPVCWTTNVLNVPANLPTPGGYCSSPCSKDADCGPFGTCEVLPTQPDGGTGGTGTYCLAGCTDGTTCRHPSYACFFGAHAGGGYCYNSASLDCNPTGTGGLCANGTQGCIRKSYEDLGQCQDTCMLGAAACQALPDGTRRHCIYLNATRDTQGVPTRDTFKGTVCAPLYSTAVMIGANCLYLDDCLDTLECNLSPGGDNKCRALCLIGVTGACDPGFTCTDVFAAGRGNPGLCIPN